MATISSCDGILLDLLSRVSVADLCRWKCVSKDWHCRLVPTALALRTNLAFLHLHPAGLPRFFSLTDHGRVLRHDGDGDPRSSFLAVFKEGIRRAKFLGICNGMALASTAARPSRGRHGRLCTKTELMLSLYHVVDYVVYNPVSGRVSTIPPPPRSRSNGLNFLVFDPRRSSRRYMVINMAWSNSFEWAHLYSSETSEWRDLGLCEDLPPTLMDPWRTASYCVNGIAYKVAGGSGCRKNIVAFDVEEERLFWIDSPVALPEGKTGWGNHHCQLGESAGHLSYAYYEHESCTLMIWVLKDCGAGEWVLTHNVGLNGAATRPAWLPSVFSLAFHPVDAEALFVSLPGSLCLFNLKTSELQQVTQAADFISGSLYPYLCPQ